MNKNFTCPRCRSKQAMSKKLHGSWTCPKCKNTIIPTKEIVNRGFVVLKRSKMFDNV